MSEQMIIEGWEGRDLHARKLDGTPVVFKECVIQGAPAELGFVESDSPVITVKFSFGYESYPQTLELTRLDDPRIPRGNT